jgi:ADP-heptose:LPS heptosyltransferase
MGLGGYLTWTAVAREICERVQGSKVLPVEMHGQLMRPIVSEVFFNNPRMTQNLSESNNQYCIPMILNNPSANYCKEDHPTHAVHRYDRHIIEQICEVYGIPNPKLKCEIYLTDEEKNKVSWVSESFSNNQYVVIEPQSNDEYSVNKVYPIEKWQKVTDSLNNMGLNVVQVGKQTQDKKLAGVTDLTGLTSFRSAAAIIEGADLFVSSEGGLMHAANAVETKSIIVYSGFIHPTLTSYKENTNIWVGKDHGPCGKKVKCPECYNSMDSHDQEEIVESVRSALKNV